jgi:hypothetical protein
MAVYVVTYDLKLGAGNHSYEDLWRALDQLHSVKILYSVYLVSTNSSAFALHTHLKQFIDTPDRIWVSRVTDDHSGYVMAQGVSWLEQRQI